jgi:hypothetical protein
LKRDIYRGRLKITGEGHRETLAAAINYAIALMFSGRFEEAKSVLRKMVPVARRVLGESHELTLTMRKIYGGTLHENPSATLDDVRESVATL